MNQQTVSKVHNKLARAYGPLPKITKQRPLDSLIHTILSQNTSDVNSHRAFRELKRTFPSWTKADCADAGCIASAIHEGGLAQVKSIVIKKVLHEIRKREGRLSLARLSSMPDDEAIDYLLGLPGVGIKTATCVLLFSLGRSVFPVDTHVYRTTTRLGWLDDDVKLESATEHLQPMIPKNLRLGLHLYLVQHGRATCKARNPLCGQCPVSRHCTAYRDERL